jgi:hypothetical protein
MSGSEEQVATGGKSIDDSAAKELTPSNLRMVAGAKFGLVFFCLWLIFFAFIIITVNWDLGAATDFAHRYSDEARLLNIAFGVLLGICGCITAIQKGRPGIGVLALFLGQIGFIISLCAEDRRNNMR